MVISFKLTNREECWLSCLDVSLVNLCEFPGNSSLGRGYRKCYEDPCYHSLCLPLEVSLWPMSFTQPLSDKYALESRLGAFVQCLLSVVTQVMYLERTVMQDQIRDLRYILH